MSKQTTGDSACDSQVDSITIDRIEDDEQLDDNEQTKPTTVPTVPSHLFNTDAHPAYIRYGVPLWITCTFALLLASDLGSGVSAELRLSVRGEIKSHDTILTVSIFSSVGELWKTQSYPLAILIVITSICWPYVKLGLSMLAWVTRPVCGGVGGPVRRERLIEWLDALDKWSFVDIFVLTIMMIVFRSTIPVGREDFGITNDVYIVPKWGFFGYVFASIASQLSTHFIMHQHRRVIYPELYEPNTGQDADVNGEEEMMKDEEEKVIEEDRKEPLFRKSGHSPLLIAILLLATFCLLLAGCLVTSFIFTYERGDRNKIGYIYEERDFSIANLGVYIADAAINPNDFGIRFLQVIYYVLAIVTPLENIIIFFILYFVPLKDGLQRKLFYLSEITFAWGAAEVMMVSAIFSVKQIPDFGTGIVDSGCSTCYVVGARLEGTFWVYFAAAVLNLFMTFWLFNGAHKQLYNTERYKSGRKCCCCC